MLLTLCRHLNLPRSSLCSLTPFHTEYSLDSLKITSVLKMDDNPEDQQVKEQIKDCQKTVNSLVQEYESLIQKQKSTVTAGDSARSVKKACLADYESKRMMEVAKVTINQQVELSDDNNGQIGANLNPIVQALFNGTLPDDFYLHLMSVIGIQECLLSNRLVCSLWNDLVLERCQNQKSLKLFENFKCLMNYGEWLLKFEKMNDNSLILKSIGDDLIFEGLEIYHTQLINILEKEEYDYEVRAQKEEVECDVQNEVFTRDKKREASKVLTNLFPRVNQLVLCPECESFINVKHIIQFYAEQLTSLTVTDFSRWQKSPCKLRSFSFPLLKSLNTFNFSPEDDQLLSLLPQLESLTLRSSKISLETFLRTGTQLQELNMFYFKSVYNGPVEQFSKRPPINSNLRKLSFANSTKDNLSETLEFISHNITSLKGLKLDFDQANVSHLHMLTSYLLPLHQLNSLTLQAPVSFFLLDDNQLAEIQPLPSVRQLKLLLSGYDSLSMDLFSRALFTAFPNVEQALIGFLGNDDDGHVDADTLAAFEDFASKHPNVVQLFRSKDMSKFTNLPNAVSPMLGPHRQVYEESIDVEELFGVALCQLTASLVKRQGEDRPNLKSALRPADRFTAMSNLLQLLESGAFSFTYNNIDAMIRHMSKCALKYDPSEIALFSVSCKCILILLNCDAVDLYDSDKKTSFLDIEESFSEWDVYSLFEMTLNLVEHYKIYQFDDKSLLLQLYRGIVRILKYDFPCGFDVFDEDDLKKSLKLASYYKTQQLTVLDIEEKLLLPIYGWIDLLLEMFKGAHRLGKVIRKLIRSKVREYRVEIECALHRCSERKYDNYNYHKYFKLLPADSDSSDG